MSNGLHPLRPNYPSPPVDLFSTILQLPLEVKCHTHMAFISERYPAGDRQPDSPVANKQSDLSEAVSRTIGGSHKNESQLLFPSARP
jgi:hypothetical protein